MVHLTTFLQLYKLQTVEVNGFLNNELGRTGWNGAIMAYQKTRCDSLILARRTNLGRTAYEPEFLTTTPQRSVQW
jgi:hypothetical protein